VRFHAIPKGHKSKASIPDRFLLEGLVALASSGDVVVFAVVDGGGSLGRDGGVEGLVASGTEDEGS
jgi:hypothetical protein